MSSATMELRVRDIVDEVLAEAGLDRDGRAIDAAASGAISPLRDPDDAREFPPAGGSFVALAGPAAEPSSDVVGGVTTTGTLPRLIDAAVAPLVDEADGTPVDEGPRTTWRASRERLAEWAEQVPAHVSAIPAQRQRMKLIAFVAAWAIALALLVPLALQGVFSAVNLELDLSSPETMSQEDEPPTLAEVLDAR